MTPELRLFTNAFIALLERGTKKKVGDSQSPADTPSLDSDPKDLQEHFPYTVVYPIDADVTGAPLSPHDDLSSIILQVTSVGLSREQCQWMADLARRTVIARDSAGAYQVELIVPDGWVVSARLLDSGAGEVFMEGPPAHRIYSTAERFRLEVTTA